MERGTLRDYQVEDLAFHIANPRSLNLSDPGTGKTPTVCAWMFYLWSDLKVRTFWPMPKSLLKKNREELLRFSEFDPDDVVIIDGTPKQRLEQMVKDAKVFLMGFDRFRDDWDTLHGLHPDLGAVCVDEMHMGFGGHGSGRTQALYKCMRRITPGFFIGMTGTLINGRLSSAFPAIHIVCPDYYASYDGFLNQHAVRDWYGTIIGWKAHDKIKGILKLHSIRHSFTEVYGDQSPVIAHELIPMAPKQLVAYQEFEKAALLELDDEFLDGGMPGTAAIRCRQIMAHPEMLPTPSGAWADLMRGERTGKDERLLIHLEDHKNTGKPLIIFGTFQKELARIQKLVAAEGMTVCKIDGSVMSTKRPLLDEGFRKGTYQVMVASWATAGVGYNWGHVDHVIGVSIDYQDSSFTQGYKRAIRGVRGTPLLVTLFEYENSIEQRIFQIVEAKSASANLVDDSYDKLNLRGLPPPPKHDARTQGILDRLKSL